MSVNRGIAQNTLTHAVACTGVGLHGGRPVTATLRPAPPNAGIVFVRKDLGGAVIPAAWDRVTDTRLCTVLSGAGGATVATVEHLMAALRGANVDNVVVEVDGPELPILDGSAGLWLRLIRRIGITPQAAKRRYIKILQPVTVFEGDKLVALTPAGHSRYTVSIDFASEVIGSQKRSLALVDDAFDSAIAEARTFGFLHEVEYLRSIGLARGGSLDNAVVIDGDSIVNPEGLRYRDEFVRHKILDAVGDLYLAQAPILGHFQGVKPGHALNNKLLHALFAQPETWACVTADQADQVPVWDDEPLAAYA